MGEQKKLLSPLAYRMLRHEDTERACTSPLQENRQPVPVNPLLL